MCAFYVLQCIRESFCRILTSILNRLAKGLLALGIGKGEHVAVWATNVPEWVMLEIALAKIGAVLVTVNTNYRVAEIEYVLRQGDITTLFMIEGFRGTRTSNRCTALRPS